MSRPAPDGFAVVRADGCLRLIGELDLAGVPVVEASIPHGVGNKVTLDCSGLTFIDIAGMNALIGAHQRCVSAGSQLALVAPPRCLTWLLELTGVDGLFTVQSSTSE